MIAVVPLLICLFGIGDCNGDFGRIRPEFITDDMHSWVGSTAARDADVTPSNYPLTDEERRLRDLSYPLIEPAYDRNRFYAVIHEYGISNFFTGWPHYDRLAYAKRLMVTPYRSATARYSQLNTDIRNDAQQIPAFCLAARVVLDLDSKRAKSLQVVQVNASERANAISRNGENALLVEWVQQSLIDRAEAYRAALDRLVIATPTPMAVETERSISLLRSRIAECQVALGRAPGSGVAPTARPLVTK